MARLVTDVIASALEERSLQLAAGEYHATGEHVLDQLRDFYAQRNAELAALLRLALCHISLSAKPEDVRKRYPALFDRMLGLLQPSRDPMSREVATQHLQAEAIALIETIVAAGVEP